MPKKIRIKHILFRMKNKIVKKELECPETVAFLREDYATDARVKLCIAKPIKASEQTLGVLAW